VFFSWKEKYLIWVRHQVSLWRKQTAERIRREANNKKSQPTSASSNLTKLQSLVASEKSTFEYHVGPLTDCAIMKVRKK
jgi:hypothetical protein